MFARFLFFILLTAPLLSHSAIIVKIKGNRCFVHLEGSPATVGDHFTALDLFGKPKGVIRLDKIKNDKAIATVVDGRADINWILERTTQTKLETVSVLGLNKQNKVGVTGSAGRITVKKNIRETQRQHGWTAGGLLFFEWPFHKFFSLNVASGLLYYVVDRNTDRSSSRGSINDEPLQMTGFPSFQLALKFHIPVAGKTNLWVSAGGSVSKWNNINDNYQVFDKSQFKFQLAGNVMLGIDFIIPRSKYTIPIAISYSCVQCGGEWFDKNVLGKKSKPGHIPLDISEITFHIGISQPI